MDPIIGRILAGYAMIFAWRGIKFAAWHGRYVIFALALVFFLVFVPFMAVMSDGGQNALYGLGLAAIVYVCTYFHVKSTNAALSRGHPDLKDPIERALYRSFFAFFIGAVLSYCFLIPHEGRGNHWFEHWIESKPKPEKYHRPTKEEIQARCDGWWTAPEEFRRGNCVPRSARTIEPASPAKANPSLDPQIRPANCGNSWTALDTALGYCVKR